MRGLRGRRKWKALCKKTPDLAQKYETPLRKIARNSRISRDGNTPRFSSQRRTNQKKVPSNVAKASMIQFRSADGSERHWCEHKIWLVNRCTASYSDFATGSTQTESKSDFMTGSPQVGVVHPPRSSSVRGAQCDNIGDRPYPVRRQRKSAPEKKKNGGVKKRDEAKLITAESWSTITANSVHVDTTNNIDATDTVTVAPE